MAELKVDVAKVQQDIYSSDYGFAEITREGAGTVTIDIVNLTDGCLWAGDTVLAYWLDNMSPPRGAVYEPQASIDELPELDEDLPVLVKAREIIPANGRGDVEIVKIDSDGKMKNTFEIATALNATGEDMAPRDYGVAMTTARGKYTITNHDSKVKK